jgi:hypothetical protein
MIRRILKVLFIALSRACLIGWCLLQRFPVSPDIPDVGAVVRYLLWHACLFPRLAIERMPFPVPVRSMQFFYSARTEPIIPVSNIAAEQTADIFNPFARAFL